MMSHRKYNLPSNFASSRAFVTVNLKNHVLHFKLSCFRTCASSLDVTKTISVQISGRVVGKKKIFRRCLFFQSVNETQYSP